MSAEGVVGGHMLAGVVRAANTGHLLTSCGLPSDSGLAGGSLGVGGGLLAGDNVDEEVKHIRFGQGSGNIGTLEGTALVLLGMYPGAHS